jgi:hypothetical protein
MGTKMTTKQVKKKVKSCWPGATRGTLKTPLGELTYVGLLPTTFRTQLIDIGLSQRQIERIGKETAMHALKVTIKLMWKPRVAAMEEQGRTLQGYLRRAGMVHGVAPTQTPTNANTVTEAVNKLRTEAVEATANERAPTTQGTRKYSPSLPIGTVLWEEPHGAMGIVAHDEFRRGGARGGADTRVKAGKYRYVVHRERIDDKDKYVTTDGKGMKPKILTQTQACAQLVHTDGMRKTHHRNAKTMRKSAIRTTTGIAVVWSIKASTLEQTKILIYEGQAKLTKIGDEELIAQHTWLRSEHYDTAVRDAIDELWEEIGKRDMWYAMGASVGEYTIMGTSGDEWEMEHDDGTTKTISKNELIIMLHEQAKDVKWTATEGSRDRVPIVRDIAKRASNIRLQTSSSSRTARALTRATNTGNLAQGDPNDIGFFRRGPQRSRTNS